ncbi:hypothetical protein [Flavonifractor sp. An306]|uniref:hypothetical protein n=1 Tax=Flavonifractor sp. An306 TaxID=1965629 RepID=UPI000B3A7A63|nr:hypothetical protein [Flavonifractor sp. An306]OUO36504.1 hypothetical protein B5F88_13785 [Flavonifractor sp. An306]
MDASIELNYENPVFSEEEVCKMTTGSLEGFYGETQNSYKQYELFFALLNSLHHYLSEGKKEVAAKISYLIAYYLHIALTPIANLELASYYIEKAIELDARQEYLKWKVAIDEDLGK